MGLPFISGRMGRGGTLASATGGGGGGGAFVNDYSISLDGTDDFINCGNDSSLAPANITLSAWVKVSGSVTTYNYILSKAGSNYGSIHLRYTSSNKFNVHLGLASSFINNVTSSSSYTLTDWHHVAFTYDQTNVKLYVDSIEEYSASETRAIDYAEYDGGGTDFNIGRTSYLYPSPAEGLIDEVAMFNSALTATQISNIYNSGVPNDLGTDGLNLSPLGWWRMGDNDGGTGTTITDQGSGGNDGTLEGGPTFSTTVPS